MVCDLRKDSFFAAFLLQLCHLLTLLDVGASFLVIGSLDYVIVMQTSLLLIHNLILIKFADKKILLSKMRDQEKVCGQLRIDIDHSSLLNFESTLDIFESSLVCPGMMGGFWPRS